MPTRNVFLPYCVQLFRNFGMEKMTQAFSRHGTPAEIVRASLDTDSSHFPISWNSLSECCVLKEKELLEKVPKSVGRAKTRECRTPLQDGRMKSHSPQIQMPRVICSGWGVWFLMQVFVIAYFSATETQDVIPDQFASCKRWMMNRWSQFLMWKPNPPQCDFSFQDLGKLTRTSTFLNRSKLAWTRLHFMQECNWSWGWTSDTWRCVVFHNVTFPGWFFFSNCYKKQLSDSTKHNQLSDMLLVYDICTKTNKQK